MLEGSRRRIDDCHLFRSDDGEHVEVTIVSDGNGVNVLEVNGGDR